jgi:DNA-3-methyladenine glycosylase I
MNEKDRSGFRRCEWVNGGDELYTRYHDEEWGKPVHDDRRLFEMLILESFQAGLSWITVLRKREAFRKAFDGFSPEKIAGYGPEKIEELMQDSSIIRNRRKIEAAVNNSKVFMNIAAEYGSFSDYLWHFTNGRVIHESWKKRTTSPLSDEVAKDLKKRGMKFVGSTIIYSYLQAVGVIDGHDEGCYLFSTDRT